MARKRSKKAQAKYEARQLARRAKGLTDGEWNYINMPAPFRTRSQTGPRRRHRKQRARFLDSVGKLISNGMDRLDAIMRPWEM